MAIGSILGAAAGGLAQGAIGLLGNDRAADQVSQAGALSAAQIQALAQNVKPQATTTSLGFGYPNNAFMQSPITNEQISQLLGFGRLAYQGAAVNPPAANFTQRFLDSLDRIQGRREAEQFANLESRLFNRAGVSTGTAQQVRDFQSQLEEARQARMLNIEKAMFEREQQGYNRENDLFDRFIRTVAGTQQIGQNELAQMQLGINAGGLQSPFGYSAANVLGQSNLLAGQTRAASTQGFFDSLGQAVGGAVSRGIGGIFGGGTPSTSGGGGFVSNPFVNTSPSTFWSPSFGSF